MMEAPHNQSCGGKSKDLATAVFDFDRTIIPVDLTKEFLKWRIANSVPRFILMVLFSPLVVLLMLNQPTRIYGINLINIVATCGYRKSIFHLRHQFMAYYFIRFSTPVYKDAIRRINKHKESGVKVIILSASPTWLLHGFIKRCNIRPDHVIGSHQQVRFNSLITKNFCYGKNKVEMAKGSGLDPSKWTYGYTDSPEDIPFLRYCINKTSINTTSKRARQKFKHCFHENINNEIWH